MPAVTLGSVIEKLFLTHASGPQEGLLDMVKANYTAYAERHGYQFEAVRGTVDTDGRSSYWSKIVLMREWLSRAKVLLWFDCDLVIRRQDLDIVDEFYPDDFQALCLEYLTNGPSPNPGVWLLRNVDEAHEFLKLLWETGDLPDADLPEQATLGHLLGFSYLPSFTKPVRGSPYLLRTGWLDPRWNCIDLFHPEARLSAHAVHFAGVELVEKAVGIRQQLSRERLPGWIELEDPAWREQVQRPMWERYPHPERAAAPSSQ